MWSFIGRSITMRCLTLPQSLPVSLLSINKTHVFRSGFSYPFWRSTVGSFCSTSGVFTRMGDRGVSALQSFHNQDSISYLLQREAAEIDETLMGPLGTGGVECRYINCRGSTFFYSLFGLSLFSFVLFVIVEHNPSLPLGSMHLRRRRNKGIDIEKQIHVIWLLLHMKLFFSFWQVYRPSEYNRVLAICGPGNNGGDGLVAARHLHHFGYKPYICYPKRTPKPLYTGLVTQLESLSVPFLSVEDLPLDLSNDFDILVDAMFGFSFHGAPRPPFDDLIRRMICLHNYGQTRQKPPVIVSIDIPSGWHVEEGDIDGEGIKPDMLVSLTAPKLCAKKFSGPHHFLGGRFVPPFIADKFKLHLPPYPGTAMCVRIGKPPQIDISALRENYISPEFLEEYVEADPMDQFRKWFDDAVAAGLKEPNAMALSTAGKDGKPSSRIVLLKGVDKDGFVWYTNYGSRKAHEISENPHASLLFYWDGLNRQVNHSC
ncbi:Pyridoxine/pyridoxamine 5'-phosphate oxidase 1, chloroplastic [Vitis vinifera]|uniref:NAD(P)H-hydrate epimerase n=1 Tax=Vitis vinifera TaxID=29760 RepID=A0A438F7S3_VITVI|nr:Pyridoxine/pyridoxamine 5'-phosphate oxidase 1, chloroplastic [Vitis vinifera]